jgi:hypothetical protein
LYVIFRILIVLALLTGGLIAPVYSQILDDTTRQIYGPSTTRYVTESDVFHNLDRLYTIDTSLTRFDQYDFAYLDSIHHQDLGQMGTAMQPLYYRLPGRLGVRSGYEAYSNFAYNPYQVKYYNTRSPYTFLDYVQGGDGRQMLSTGLSRNVTPRFNLGFEYRRMSSDRQLQVPPQRDQQKLVDHHSFVGQGNYASANNRYRLLANFTYLSHFAFETGGIRFRPGTPRSPEAENREDFLYRDAATWLSARTRTHELQSNWHLYHHYNLAEGGGIQLYHIVDHSRQRNFFADPALLESFQFDRDNIRRSFYPVVNNAIENPVNPRRYFLEDTTATNHNRYFRSFQNTVGIKGRVSGFNYGIHARRRDVHWANNAFRPNATYIDSTNANIAENYLGGFLRYDFSQRSFIIVDAEGVQSQGRAVGDYSLQARFHSRWLQAQHTRMVYSPTALEQYFWGNHFQWNNNFLRTQADRTLVSTTLTTTWVSLTPYLENVFLTDYIYFNQEAQPVQSRDLIAMLSAGSSMSLRLGPVRGEALYRVTLNSREDLIRVPRQYIRGRLYYERSLFANALVTQVGGEVRWLAAYLADGYMPVTNQFHLQDGFIVNPHPIGDVFVNVRIKRALIALKMQHVNQGIAGAGNGYYTTPFYSGQRRIFEFQIRWSFFD